MLLPAGVMDEMGQSPISSMTWTKTVNTVKCFRWWTKTSPETC